MRDQCASIFPSKPRHLKNQGRELSMVLMPVIPAFWRLRQEDSESEANLNYRRRPCFKKEK
jgi:hypothetical protein